MKKYANYVNKILWSILLCAGLVITGCYDDSAIQEQLGSLNEQLKDHESRLKELERLTARQNTNIESLQTIVTALQDKDYVTNVSPINEGDKVMGYTITFSKSGAVTIYNGKYGYVPVMGVKQDESDGQWYWTLDGEWMRDSKGDKVRASAIDGEDGDQGTPSQPGVTPILKIVDGYWYVSYDGGKTWEEETLGQATSDNGDSMFSDVSYDEHSVTLTLSDGVVLTIPRSGSDKLPLTLMVYHTATTAVFSGTVDLDEMAGYSGFGFAWSLDEEVTIDDRDYMIERVTDGNKFTQEVKGLPHGTTIYYALFVSRAGICMFDQVRSFKTDEVTIDIDNVSVSWKGTVFSGHVDRRDVDSEVRVGIEISSDSAFSNFIRRFLNDAEISPDGAYSVTMGLSMGVNYYRTFTEQIDGRTGEYYRKYGQVQTCEVNLGHAADLSSSASANSYIVSNAGLYKFKAVKSNSSESVGNVASAEVLWESFGTPVTPNVGDLIKSASYKDGYITFQTADTYKEGNAVIAAKDADGNILWSWHIWFTDEPRGQVYYHNAGTMMDRNLGATSATKGDVGALGLLYQWGRKDPFLGSSSISSSTLAKSTIAWPSSVSSDSSNGTIEYATAHPTTFITYNRSNFDWYYTGDSSTDNTRWTTSESSKSIYDPCPVGWRVPDGGDKGVWSTAFSLSLPYYNGTYDSTNEGMAFSFSPTFIKGPTAWYPASGCRDINVGILSNVGSAGLYWSASPYSNGSYSAYNLYFLYNGYVSPSDYSYYYRAYGFSVRCIQE